MAEYATCYTLARFRQVYIYNIYSDLAIDLLVFVTCGSAALRPTAYIYQHVIYAYACFLSLSNIRDLHA
jgi:hypothetical protein